MNSIENMEIILEKEIERKRMPKRSNVTKLKKDLREVMKHHGMQSKHISHAIKHLDGAGFFDFIKKAVGAVKKGISFYNENKDAIHGAIGKAKDVVGKAKSAYEGYKEDGLRGAIKKVAGGSKSGGRLRAKRAGGSKSGGARNPSAWVSKCKAYAKEHDCSYKEAMMRLGKH